MNGTTTITTDSRGRAPLGAKDTTFKMTTLEDGSLLLEPARILTRAELEIYVNTELRVAIEESSERLDEGHPRRKLKAR
ncbi:hypothetical protein Bequi_02955 [Brachybacterium sp. JHP9]|uniref:Uncharacterized protein n=1 Tax=Brachybacterium equifaecis TaxID=2910770 RepID=A0ABT0R059_9MICO|nr:hypothetical protein [Brachybacterium equifaecis]MCL6422350.1 hypothetical protein [Brachybacterium equifaecis]